MEFVNLLRLRWDEQIRDHVALILVLYRLRPPEVLFELAGEGSLLSTHLKGRRPAQCTGVVNIPIAVNHDVNVDDSSLASFQSFGRVDRPANQHDTTLREMNFSNCSVLGQIARIWASPDSLAHRG
jgi:hypothetical protein